jgi:hypothetical protein
LVFTDRRGLYHFSMLREVACQGERVDGTVAFRPFSFAQRHCPGRRFAMPEKRSFTTIEAAHYIGVSVYTLKLARCDSPRNETRSFVPPRHFVAEGGRILYLREELDRWIDERAVNHPRRRRA